MTTICGSVDRIVFHNPETGYLVARFTLADGEPSSNPVTTITGTMPTVRSGEMLRLIGEWQVHPVHGRNFRVEQFEPELPSTAAGIERYLASGAIRGIGPITARRIVEKFGDQSIHVLDEQPELLRAIAGISAKRLDVIREAWTDQVKIRDLMMFLQAHGVSVALAPRIYAMYREDALAVIKADPYQLAHEVNGIGFRTADILAARLGVSRRSISRFIAGLKYELSRATEDGHVFLPRRELIERSVKLLDAPPEMLEPALLELLRRGDATIDADDVYLTAFFRAEAGAAQMLAAIASTPSPMQLDPEYDAVALAQEAGARQGLELAPLQREAAVHALREKITILTGGPGTGKTSTLRTIITALRRADVTFCLCAPTGRAAKRVAETTGHPASTIHRLLEYQPGMNVYGYDRNRPLPYDFVIVDEVSMLDILLFYHLLKAIPPESHLLLVGDADQLPSVGPGNVLRDLLNSDRVPAIRLTELFRQARGSQIVLAAHAINRGEIPRIDNDDRADIFFLRQADEAKVAESIRSLAAERIPARFGFHPLPDIQVISPMHAGPAGVSNLNVILQAKINPRRKDRPELHRGTHVFRLGDKVMQIRNNYDKEVFNGDMGVIVDVDSTDQLLTVAYVTGDDSLEVEYGTGDLDELVLAYAISVHKSQGSEFPCVIMPLVARHYILLRRNLLYTAISRAKQLCVLVGSPRSLATAVNDAHRPPRNTRLAQRVREPGPDQLTFLPDEEIPALAR